MGIKASHSASPHSTTDDDIRRLESDYKRLHDDAQRLITERVQLESDLSKLKKKTVRLDDEVRLLKSPPMIIGHIQDVLDKERAIVRSSNGTIFQVSLNPRLDSALVKPGTRVALNQDSLAVIEILSDAWDPLVSGAEIIDKPEITYADIGGLDEQMEMLRESIELPLHKPELFRKVGIKPPKGVLMVGPPGCGKTMLAKAVAQQTDATFIRMVGSELAQKYIGEGGRMVRELFALAKEKAPSIIFLDEIDAIGAKRLDGSTSGDREVQRTLMQLLAELDGFDSLEGVKIIAATNRPDILDEALMRPGRFDRIIEIPVPDGDGRKSILSLCLKPMSKTSFGLGKIIDRTENFSGAELNAVCVEAGMIAIRQSRGTITQKDMFLAIDRVVDKRHKNGDREGLRVLYG